MRRIGIACFTLFICLTALPGEELILGVVPFDNLSGNASRNHVGFQISEFLVSAYSAFDGVTVVERGALQKVLDEQKLQLSGLTRMEGAVEIGQLLNTRQVLQGSYHYPGSDLEISGRIIDVESGEVIAAATVSGPSADIRPVLKALLYRLIEAQQGGGVDLAITIPVEAKLVSLENQSIESIETYAKALEAAFKQNDQEALGYLQKAISGTELNYTAYSDAAEAYLETYKRIEKIEGETIYTRMLKKQIDTNQKLLEQAEDISIYRNTVKLLFEKIVARLNADILEMETEETYDMADGTVSVSLTPPRKISIAVREEVKQEILSLFDGQEVMRRQGGRISPAGLPATAGLLPRAGLESLFEFDISADVSYAVQFVSPEGEVVYQLDPIEPLTVFTIREGVFSWSAPAADQYNEHAPRSGWRYENGQVVIQARELINLGDVRVIIRPDSFRRRSYMPVYEDRIWQSVIMHAYRQKYVKISPADGDPCPQVKDIELANYFLTFPDFPLKRIPLIKEDRRYPSFADLTAVVYWADESTTLVEGHWSGVLNAESPTITGELNPNSVLYFPVQNSGDGWEDFKTGSARFTVRNSGQEKGISFTLEKGMIHTDETDVKNFAADGELLFVVDNDTAAYRKLGNRMERVWHDDNGADNCLIDGELLYTADDPGITAYRASDGREVMHNESRTGYDLEVSGDYLYLSGRAGTYCLEGRNGSELWRYPVSGVLSLAGEWLLVGPYVLNRITGEKRYTLKSGRTSIDVLDALAIGNKFIVTGNHGTTCYRVGDVEGQPLWRQDQSGFRMFYTSGRVFVTSERHTSCIDIESGSIMWQSDKGGREILVHDNIVYAGGRMICALDAQSGELIWTSGADVSDFAVLDHAVAAGYTNEGFFVFDPAVFFE